MKLFLGNSKLTATLVKIYQKILFASFSKNLENTQKTNLLQLNYEIQREILDTFIACN